MTALITKSTARKRYPCAWACGSDIEPGQPYVRWAFPPGFYRGGDGWVSGIAHGERPEECPTFDADQPAKETR